MAKKAAEEKKQEPKDTGIRYLVYRIDDYSARIYKTVEDAVEGEDPNDFGMDGGLSLFKIQFLEELQAQEKWEPVKPMDLAYLV